MNIHLEISHHRKYHNNPCFLKFGPGIISMANLPTKHPRTPNFYSIPRCCIRTVFNCIYCLKTNLVLFSCSLIIHKKFFNKLAIYASNVWTHQTDVNDEVLSD